MEELHTNLTEQPTAAPEPVAPQKPPVPARDRVLAFALLALGYLVCRFRIMDHPLLGLIYGLALFGLTVWHFRGRVGKRTLGLWTVSFLFLLSHLLTDNGPVRFFARWLAVLLWGYGVYCAGGNSAEERLGDMFVPEAFKADILMPFSKLSAFFTAAFSGGKRNWLKTILLVLLGLGLALVPLLLVVNLLQYDAAFSKLLDHLLSDDLPEEIFKRLLYLMLAVGMAILLMSCLFGSGEHRMARVLDREAVAAFRIRRRFLPLLAGCAMLIPLLAVYGLFFFSQWPLYTSAFTGVLPKGYTYADYAREGFFQLCAVCAVNGFLYLFVSLFTKRERGEGVRRAMLTVLCLCSLVLAATACSKMVLYVRTYGLTPKRVYASWAMILLVAAFLLALVGAYWRKLNITRALFGLFVCMFGFLCLCDTNALIADYNVRAYAEGRLETVDTGVFWDLGDSAVPAAARLANDPKYGDEVKRFLSRHGQRSAFDALCHGVPGLRARAVCEPYWMDPTTVHVRIETEDDFAALACWYGEKGYEHSAGTSVNADGTPYARGQGTFFDLEQRPWDGWDAREEGDTVRFQLSVTDEMNRDQETNQLTCCYGETIYITLTGSREQGYAIVRTD
jgi:hypothetical protein